MKKNQPVVSGKIHLDLKKISTTHKIHVIFSQSNFSCNQRNAKLNISKLFRSKKLSIGNVAEEMQPLVLLEGDFEDRKRNKSHVFQALSDCT